MIAAALLLLGLSPVRSSSTTGDLPFVFVLEAADSDRYQHPGLADGRKGGGVEIRLDGAAGPVRVDVLELANRLLPRWRWRQAWIVREGAAVLEGTPGVETLIVIRKPDGNGYSLDGPFRWPEKPERHSLSAARFRTLRGLDQAVSGGARFSLSGQDSPVDNLCEDDGQSRWQCLAVPKPFAGIVVVCPAAAATSFAEISPEAGDDVALQHPAWATAVVLGGRDSAEAGSSPPEFKLLRPGPAGGQILVADPSLASRILGANLFWLFGSSPATEEVLVIRSSSHRFTRLSLAALLSSSACGQSAAVVLEAEKRIFGSVFDLDGNVMPRPMIFVMEESERGVAAADPGKPARVLSGVAGNENGQYECGELGSRSYLVRACHGSVGCAEKRAVPSDQPLDFRLEGRGVFKGRLLSPAGVPEPGTAVRIVPTLSQYGQAKDRFRFLPLETVAGSDGRFLIAAPSTGEFLLEARSLETGTARREVRVTEVSTQTDLGDIRLPPLVEFSGEVPGCGGGALRLIGPVGGNTSLPNVLEFPVDRAGVAVVRLPDGGAWLTGATCSGIRKHLEPLLLSRAEDLTGQKVRFKLIEEGKPP